MKRSACKVMVFATSTSSKVGIAFTTLMTPRSKPWAKAPDAGGTGGGSGKASGLACEVKEGSFVQVGGVCQ